MKLTFEDKCTMWASIIVLLLMIVFGCCGCKRDVYTPPIKEYIYVPVKDTVAEANNIQKIIALEHELKLTRDTLNNIRDSIGDELFIARYKLARIKEYNRIAGQGNNIKYLRGWINRVLNE